MMTVMVAAMDGEQMAMTAARATAGQGHVAVLAISTCPTTTTTTTTSTAMMTTVMAMAMGGMVGEAKQRPKPLTEEGSWHGETWKRPTLLLRVPVQQMMGRHRQWGTPRAPLA